MLPRMGTPGGEGISGMMDTGKGITIIQGAQGMGWEEEEKNPKPTTEVLQEMGQWEGLQLSLIFSLHGSSRSTDLAVAHHWVRGGHWGVSSLHRSPQETRSARSRCNSADWRCRSGSYWPCWDPSTGRMEPIWSTTGCSATREGQWGSSQWSAHSGGKVRIPDSRILDALLHRWCLPCVPSCLVSRGSHRSSHSCFVLFL